MVSEASAVEEPGMWLSTNRVLGVFRHKNNEKEMGKGSPPLPFRQLFQIHGSKFKLHPVSHLGEASVLGITQLIVHIFSVIEFVLRCDWQFYLQNKIWVKF